MIDSFRFSDPTAPSLSLATSTAAAAQNLPAWGYGDRRFVYLHNDSAAEAFIEVHPGAAPGSPSVTEGTAFAIPANTIFGPFEMETTACYIAAVLTSGTGTMRITQGHG